MSLTKVLLVSLSMGVGSLAFATDPTPPDPTPPAATAVSPAATADAASAAAADKAAADKDAAAGKAKDAAATAKTATSPEGLTPDQAKTLRMAGYKAEGRRGGVTVYCRNQTTIGSRFEQKSCGTPEDILRSIAANQELVNQMQHGSLNSQGVH